MTYLRCAWIIVFSGILMLLPSQTFAQSRPFLTYIANSASYSGSGIAQGSIFVAFGDNLGPSKLVQAASYPLTTQLAGTSATVRVGGSIIPCPMIYTSANQIAAILPSNTPLGDGTLAVAFNGLTTVANFIRVVKGAVGIFTVSSSGTGPGILTGADYITKTLAKPAKRGETLIAWVTGLGPVEGGDTAPNLGKQFPDTEVFVGDRAAKVIYAGRSGCCAGLDQIVFEVPDAPLSCFVPVSIRTPGESSNFVTVPISAGGEPCSNPTPGIPAALLSRALAGEQITVAMLGVGPVPVLQGAGFSFSQGIADQLSKILHVAVREADVARLIHAYRARNMAAVRKIMGQYSPYVKTLDTRAKNLIRAAVSRDQQGAAATFHRSSGIVALTPQLAANIPAVGTCMVVRRIPTDSTLRTRPLDAGSSLTVESPLGRKTMVKISNGQYQAVLGAGSTQASTVPGFYTISGTGGADVGAFSTSVNITNSLVWTNKSSVTDIDRTRPLTLTWSGGSVPGYVLIGGTLQSFDGPAIFTCVEETRRGTFAIPQFVLSALPSSPDGTLFISPHPFSNPITIPGLDLAFLGDASSDSRFVAYR